MHSTATSRISAGGASIPAPRSKRRSVCCAGTSPTIPSSTCWAVEEKKSKRLIGMINYARRDMRERRVEVGWIMVADRQGKGYMTEAARALLRYLIDRLRIHKIEALIRPENKPSAALAKRLGFRLEGGPIRDRWWV